MESRRLPHHHDAALIGIQNKEMSIYQAAEKLTHHHEAFFPGRVPHVRPRERGLKTMGEALPKISLRLTSRPRA
jgi:hypothetical protein